MLSQAVACFYIVSLVLDWLKSWDIVAWNPWSSQRMSENSFGKQLGVLLRSWVALQRQEHSKDSDVLEDGRWMFGTPCKFLNLDAVQ